MYSGVCRPPRRVHVQGARYGCRRTEAGQQCSGDDRRAPASGIRLLNAVHIRASIPVSFAGGRNQEPKKQQLQSRIWHGRASSPLAAACSRETRASISAPPSSNLHVASTSPARTASNSADGGRGLETPSSIYCGPNVCTAVHRSRSRRCRRQRCRQSNVRRSRHSTALAFVRQGCPFRPRSSARNHKFGDDPEASGLSMVKPA